MKTKLWQRTVSTLLAVTLGILNIESTGLLSNILPLSNMYTAAEDGTFNQDYFTINGSVDFNEKTVTNEGKTIDWKNIVRPAVFDQNIVVVCTYFDGEKKDVEFPTQEFNKQDRFYLRFDNDGNGGGSFVIENVPGYIYVGEQKVKVSECKVIVKPKYNWYQFIDNTDSIKLDGQDLNGFQALTSVCLGLNTKKLTIIPTVTPENSDPAAAFTFDNVFESPNGIETIDEENNSVNYSESVKVNNRIEIDVPIGVNYTVTQAATDGYKLNSEYTIIKGKESSTDTDAATGEIKNDNVTIITSNFSQNHIQSFKVRWIDNNSLSRPDQTVENYSKWFSIKFKDSTGNWNLITEENYKSLGLDKLPELKLTDTGACFTGLSPVAPDGTHIEYDVVLNMDNIPQGYRADVSVDEGEQIFTFTENIDFSAEIKWNDDKNREQIRPKSITNLKLYRVSENNHGEDGLAEEVYTLTRTYEKKEDSENEFVYYLNLIDKNNEIKKIELSPDENENSWHILIPDLPRYDENNNEYDYYIAHDPINVTREPNTKKLSYNTYYENGTGSYGNDITKCHNNGKITEVLSSETNFSAQKQWLDPDADKSKRPDATVTLWRYVNKGPDGKNVNLDDAYIKGNVSQVMINDSVTGKETPLSYSLEKNKDDSTIVFTLKNSDGTSKNIILPGNDDKGQEYVYFVRESLSGDNADHYDIHYFDSDGITQHKYGALDGGTIKNVQSERVAVNVKKVWKNPESLSDIDGASVQMKILAPVLNTNNYEELIIYSEQENSHEILDEEDKKTAQTIKGFTADIPFSEVTYYADIYDELGNKLDMSRAVFQEIVTDKNGNSIYNAKDGSFEIAGTKYIPSSTYDGITTLGDGTNRYNYTQINTAKPTREYKLVKTWADSINGKYNDIKAVVFRLERISVNDLAKGSKNYQLVNDRCLVLRESGATWESVIAELDKYDINGNQYYYTATETGFITKDGKEVSLEDKRNTEKWSVLYHRNPDQTEAVNYIPDGGGGYFTITKLWQDNSDTSGRDDTVVRVYKKTELKNALEQKYNGSDADKIVDIVSLGVEYKDIPLTANNKYYTAEYSFDSPYNRSDFFVIEYSVGKASANPKPAQYTYGELISALNSSGYYSYSGTVENDNFQFDVNTVCDSNGDLMIVNTRKGETSITVNKTWNDNGNENYRPKEIKFQLYQNENPYTNTNVDKTVKISGAKIDENGVITVESDSNKNGWDFTVSNLPMFSVDGERLYYDIDEIPAENTSNVSYIQKKVETKLDGDEKNQEFTFNFENTITGTTTHEAYKYWKDKAVPKSNRPDIYFILYRYLKGDDPDSAVQYIDYKTQLWTIPSESDENADYDLKVTIEDLPRFNEEGIEYVYFFKEQLNNDGESVYGKYYGTSETIDSDDGTSYEVFTNTIVDYMSVNGTKVWKGFTGFRINDVEQYPDPIIYLYRTTLNDNDENNLMLVDAVQLNDGKKSYSFPNGVPSDEYIGNYTYVNKRYMLPKFDENGDRYKYVVKEKFNKTITDLLYTKTNVNGTLTNEFRDDINRCSIIVHKQWDRGELLSVENKYPSVTYSLYRSDNIYEAYAVRTITADEFAASGGKASCIFDNLLILSPKGEEYTYSVVENGINGYSITYYNTYGDETSISKEKQISVIPLDKVGYKWNERDVNPEIDVATKNTYTKTNRAKLSGKKLWNDRHDVEGLRPKNIKLQLTRSTLAEKGQNNSIYNPDLGILQEKETIDPDTEDPYIVWSKTGSENGMDLWEYTVYNLELYAPNGLPYTYTLSEVMDDSVYKKSDDAVGRANGSENISMSNLVNEFDKKLDVQKIWYDGKNIYKLRPEEVTIELQCSVDGGDSWQPYMTKNDKGEIVKEEVVLTEKQNSRPNTGGNTWQYTFKNLPSHNKDGQEYIYKCVETKLDGVDINEPSVPYEFRATQKDDGTYVLENELKPTSLVVEKTWENDEDNLYSSRPDSITFMLQKQVVDENVCHSTVDENGNQIMVDENGNPITWNNVMKFTLKPDKDGVWKTTLYNLPIAQILLDEKNNEYRVYSLYFRAIEIDSNDEDGKLPNYDKTIQTHRYEQSLNQNISDITNTLELKKNATIKVEKKWYRKSTDPITADFELLYKIKTDDSDDAWKSFDTPVTRYLDKDGLFTWKNLPKYDRDGNELDYKVVEKSIDGYKTVEVYDETQQKYTFTNIELQNYTVRKIWQNVDYAHKAENGKFTAEFVLQRSIGGGDWGDVPGTDPIVLYLGPEKNETDTKLQDTWKDLPMYDINTGNEITYRAVEVDINGETVENDTNGDYIVTYKYDDLNAPSFTGNETVATNRMIYGFVNLSKSGAYLAPAVTETGNLQDAEFIIRDSAGNVYASKIKTNKDGHLIRNADGTYGKEHKYLITGKYTLEEVSAKKEISENEEVPVNESYSIWENGIQFTIGLNTTGEHGTAWIKTVDADDGNGIKLDVEYLKNDGSHSYDDDCTPLTKDNTPAYNIESRGIIKFTKTGKKTENGNTALDTHGDATGESDAYFGVYLDEKCTQQVAGMSASDKEHFVLTDKAQNGSDSITQLKNSDGIPYLREYNGGFSLLYGTYYVKEIVPPAGYVLDKTVRTAVISKIDKIPNNVDISEIYNGNRATISGLTDNQWNNNPNTVKIYKRDQYGRAVQLKENTQLNEKGYLELTCFAGGTFKNGQNVIRLYQDSNYYKDDVYITYEGNAWTITGLLDSDKVYTLSEPPGSVPANNILAKPVSFKVNKNGELVISGINEKESLPAENSIDFENVYKSDAADNIIVMRDVSRYLKNVALEKIELDTENLIPIPNISFKLYKVGDKADISVLEEGKFLTTDEKGRIELSELEDKDPGKRIINTQTGYPLKYGLDIGKYYFEEFEQGASDGYQISDKIYFEIKPKAVVPSNADYEDYAEVRFTENELVSNDTDGRTGIVRNKPVMAKHIELTKTDDKDSTIKLSGAEFTLEYLSITDKQTGSATNGITIKADCITDENGILKLLDGTYPDISMKGHYILTETKAPDCYMTPTHVITKIEFDVDTDDTINENIKSEGAWTITSRISDDGQTLNMNVKNEKTVVNISKLNDIVGGIKSENQKNLNGEALSGAVLKIYEVDDESGESTLIEPTLSESNNWKLIGNLKENTIYKLHEDTAPVGYMQADDIYFKIYGTNSQKQSVVYVWSGTGTPKLNGTNWSTTDNLKNNVLTMVDEAIIAPVDMQKVVGENNSYTALEGAQFAVKVGETPIGTAVSDGKGWLVWESVDKLGSVFDSTGKKVTDKTSVEGQTIILQQNESGYTFTEIYAPSHAHNEDLSYTVNISNENYVEYKSNRIGYIDIKTNTLVESRNNSTSDSDFVNPPYKSTITLHKYDNDEEAQKAGIADTEFTLYKEDGKTPYTKASMNDKVSSDGKFKTDSKGNLNIVIYDKGKYVLKETKAATGYDNSKAVLNFELTENDYGQTQSLKNNNDDIPNERLKGKVTFTKIDEKTKELLNDVEFTLTRTNTPASPANYLLKDSVTVKTGHCYKAVKNADNWEVIEIVDTEEIKTIEKTEGTDIKGKIYIEGLNWGSYRLTESKELSGYILGQTPLTYSFEVRANNLVISNTENNTKNHVSLYKTNKLDDEAKVTEIKGLEGAVFEIHEVTESGKTGDKVKFYLNENDTKPTDTVISGEGGRVTVYGLPTNNTGDGLKTYHLVEVTAPKGYKLQNTPTVFTIDRNGNVTSVGNTEVTMQNEAIKIYLKKTDKDGKGLDGAIFRLTDVCTSCDNAHHLADCTDVTNVEDECYITIPVNSKNDQPTMIPIEKVIGGHTYKLEEIKAPDGYECTAEMTFDVNTDGTISNLEKAGQGKWFEISLSEDKKTITVADEIISSVLTKVDYDERDKPLSDVEFTLKPYRKNVDRFSEGFDKDSRYDVVYDTFTFTTDAKGQFTIPDGLLKHDNKYLLCETKQHADYYLSKEAQEGVILNVQKDGSFIVERQSDYINLSKESCPVVSAEDETGKATLLFSMNKKAASFELTKNVEGNMGDLSGKFKINITAYETYKTDEIKIASNDIVLGLGDKYDSKTGDINGQNAFGALPIGAKIEIRENNDLDYQAVVVLKKDGTKIMPNDEGVVTLTLDDASTQLEIELINYKQVPIDMGVDIDADTVIPIAAFMMLSAWLYLRSRRKRDMI